MVMIIAYIGYSSQTVSCIAGGDNGTSLLPALTSFFFEALYQSHMAALSLFLGHKRSFSREQGRRTLRVVTHMGSILFACAATVAAYTIKSQNKRKLEDTHCALEMMYPDVNFRPVVEGSANTLPVMWIVWPIQILPATHNAKIQ